MAAGWYDATDVDNGDRGRTLVYGEDVVAEQKAVEVDAACAQR
jgi:hypothetical protein